MLSSVRMAAKCLKVSPRRVTQIARERGIGERVDGRWIFTLDDVLAMCSRPKAGGDRRSSSFLNRADSGIKCVHRSDYPIPKPEQEP